MTKKIPNETISAFAKTIYGEARNYGFAQIDLIRLVNDLLDIADYDSDSPPAVKSVESQDQTAWSVKEFPLRSKRLTIRTADANDGTALLNGWINDAYGKHFLLSSSTAQPLALDRLLSNPQNRVGIVQEGDTPIGAVAFLDIDLVQRRAELRKLIGKKSARGRGYAEEATRLWIRYGGECLGLEKIFVSTLQTHLRNIQLNEAIGFRVEGMLHREVLIEGQRHDVLRMGLCYDEYCRDGA